MVRIRKVYNSIRFYYRKLKIYMFLNESHYVKTSKLFSDVQNDSVSTRKTIGNICLTINLWSIPTYCISILSQTAKIIIIYIFTKYGHTDTVFTVLISRRRSVTRRWPPTVQCRIRQVKAHRVSELFRNELEL